MAGKEGSGQYCRAARFSGERSAGVSYSQVQNILFATPDCELSAYRFLIRGVYHVAVVGDPPDEGLGQEIEMALSGGTSVGLDSKTLTFLRQRRETERKQGLWVERHHRPGLGFRFGGGRE